VEGVDIGTAVKYRGVTVGHVTELELVTAEYPPPSSGMENPLYQQVMVRFRLDSHVAGPAATIDQSVAQGLRTQLEPQGITGLSYIDLSFVSPKTHPAGQVPWTPETTVIPSMPSTLAQMQTTLEEVLTSLKQADIGKMSANFSSLLATLNQEMTTGDAHQALANANNLLVNLNQVVRQSDLPGTTASVRTLAGGPQTVQILAQLNQTTAQMAQVSAQLPAVLAASKATIDQANETTADVQAQLLPILREMKATTENLRDLSASLSANPGQILAAPPPEESK